MQETTQAWKDTNREYFTRQANCILSITNTKSGRAPIIGSDEIISFTYDKSGNVLAGEITQDKITFTINDPQNRLHFGDEDANDEYKNARVEVTVGFKKPSDSGYDGINGGVYYIKEITRDSYNRKFTITAASIVSFMTERYDVVENATGVMTAGDLLYNVVQQANASKGVPSAMITAEYDEDLLESVTVEYKTTDTYSLAETIQLIANSCGCLFFVDRNGTKIVIRKPATVCERYVLAGRVMYNPLEINVSDKIGNVEIRYNHGASLGQTTYEGDKIGGTQTAENAILKDDTFIFTLLNDMYTALQSAQRTFSASVRLDPALDLFDVIAIPNGSRVDAACITGISAEFTGIWKGTIKAVGMNGASFAQMRICDLEMFTLEQLESLRINQL